MPRCALLLAVLLALASVARASSVPGILLRPSGAHGNSTAMEDGEACLSSDDYDGAIANFSRAMVDDPKSMQAVIMRANAYSQKDDYDDAIADVTRAIALDPKFANAYIMRGTFHDHAGDYARDIADENAAMKLNPTDLMPYYERGCAYIDAGEYDRAIADFERCLQPPPPADPATKTEDTSSTYGLVMIDSAGWRPNHYLGVAYLAKHDLARADNNFTLALRANDKSVDDYIQRAAARGQDGRRDAALADFAKALEIDPKNAEAYNQRGILFMRNGDFKSAVADFHAALQIDPKYLAAHNNLGMAYLDAGDPDQAIAEETQALAIDPSSTLAYSNRAQAFAAKGDESGVIADFNRAQAVAPKDPAMLSNFALVFTKMGDYGRAVAGFEQALALDPGFGGASNNLAWLLATCPDAKFRDGKRALAEATAACKLTSWEDPVSLDTFAAACAEAGDFDAAVKWEQRVLALPSLAPSDVEGARERLALFQAHKTYQEAPPAPAGPR